MDNNETELTNTYEDLYFQSGEIKKLKKHIEELEAERDELRAIAIASVKFWISTTPLGSTLIETPEWAKAARALLESEASE